MKNALSLLATAAAALILKAETATTNTNQENTKMDTLQLTREWDKTFPKSDKVAHSKVSFHNRYGITLAADLYKPRGAEGRLPAGAASSSSASWSIAYMSKILLSEYAI